MSKTVATAALGLCEISEVDSQLSYSDVEQFLLLCVFCFLRVGHPFLIEIFIKIIIIAAFFKK